MKMRIDPDVRAVFSRLNPAVMMRYEIGLMCNLPVPPGTRIETIVDYASWYCRRIRIYPS